MPIIISLNLIRFTVLILLLCTFPNLAWGQAGFEDQHDLKFIISAIESPIPENVVAQAREFDDQLMLTGEIEGEKVYLITDNRSQHVNDLVNKLLSAMGQEGHEWVVRVLDTKTPITNAFVVGGKYIYVFVGLLNESTSNDELAFVLAHELGHSLLKHNMRRQKDLTNILVGLAEMIATLSSEKTYKEVTGVTKALRASYSKIDEEEADALATAITWRAGYDPLRGADFHTRQVRKSNEKIEEAKQFLAETQTALQQAQTDCQTRISAVNQVRYRGQRVNPKYIDQTNQVCYEAEQKRLSYNQLVSEFNLAMREKQLAEIYSTHPGSQKRVAVVAALADYLRGRREVESLKQYKQSYQIMLALNKMGSVLMNPPKIKVVQLKHEQESSEHANKNLTEELQQLKYAREQGFITENEYQLKRQQILERF